MLLDSKSHDDVYDDLIDLEKLDDWKDDDHWIENSDEDSNEDLDESPDDDSDKEETSILKEILSYVKIFVFATIVALLINKFIIFNATVPTGSMISTIMKGDRLIGLRTAYWFNGPQRGDIAIFKYPDNPSEMYIKRVIGLPGDHIEIKDEGNVVNVYVNGEKLNEPYINEPMYIEHDYVYDVPLGFYFMMGDNRNNSLDSRFWNKTFVPEEDILAKAVIKYKPALQIFKDPEYE